MQTTLDTSATNSQVAPAWHPALFRAEMVNAILTGRKTQTRRFIHDQPEGEDWTPTDKTGQIYLGKTMAQWQHISGRTQTVYCRYGGPGHYLWGKETFYDRFTENDRGARWVAYRADGALINHVDGAPPVSYRADGPMVNHATGEATAAAVDFRWRPSIFMPRWAARLRLLIITIRVERLQTISNADARAEGCPPEFSGEPRDWFFELWDEYNRADESASVEANPYVWAIRFDRLAA